MIAISHPGKMGDALYSIPAAIALADRHNCDKFDFYTSEYCRPLVPLLQAQSRINEVIIPPEYKIADYGCGIQPHEMPIDEEEYEEVYHLGIRWNLWPTVDMVSYYAGLVNVTPAEYRLDVPDKLTPLVVEPEILEQGPLVVCLSRGVPKGYFTRVVDECRGLAPIIQVGWPGEHPLGGVANERMPGLLETAYILQFARVFSGGIGVNTVLSVAKWPKLQSKIILPHQGLDYRHNVERPHVEYFIGEVLDSYVESIRQVLC